MSADTAPAAMPGEEDVATDLARVMLETGINIGASTWPDEQFRDAQVLARAILDLFAPILAESRNASRYADEVLKTRADAAEANALKSMWQDRALAAEAALAEIAGQDEVEIALDPDWPRRIAAAAIRAQGE